MTFQKSSWIGSPEIHTIMETASFFLAFFIGVLSLIGYYTKKDTLFLFLGAGFLGTAMLDGYHAVVTSTYLAAFLPSNLESLAPWSWLSSRFFLSIMLFISWKYTKTKHTHLSDINIYIFTALFALLSFVLFAFLPLPPAYIDYPIGRPEEFLPALFFLLAAIGFFQLNKWKTNTFHHYLLLSIVVNLVSQTIFMATSQQLFDFQFDTAHILKQISYLILLIGLLVNTFKNFTEGEKFKAFSIQKEQENQSKDQKIKHLQEEFIFIAAHEIKGPVTTIQWNLELLKENLNKPQSQENNELIIQEIDSANHNLLTLVNNLLNITNLEFKKLKLNLQPQAIDKLIQQAIQKNKHHQNNFKVKIINLITDKTSLALGDKQKLLDVFYNIIGNAIKYNNPNGEVIISSETEGNKLHIFIKDTGIGIHKNELQKIFEKFYRSEQARNKNIKGTGLGLYISQQIIEKMDGQLWAESEGLNQGTTIHLLLPLSKPI
jgi:signal transduction histidine kinase